jgi:hypothetical protein
MSENFNSSRGWTLTVTILLSICIVLLSRTETVWKMMGVPYCTREESNYKSYRNTDNVKSSRILENSREQNKHIDPKNSCFKIFKSFSETLRNYCPNKILLLLAVNYISTFAQFLSRLRNLNK